MEKDEKTITVKDASTRWALISHDIGEPDEAGNIPIRLVIGPVV